MVASSQCHDEYKQVYRHGKARWLPVISVMMSTYKFIGMVKHDGCQFSSVMMSTNKFKGIVKNDGCQFSSVMMSTNKFKGIVKNDGCQLLVS